MPEARERPQRILKLTLAYDGTAFVGWQRQAAGVSIQGLLEDALSRIDGAPVTVIGAGRTDAGVHACGQVASARVASGLDAPTVRRALNAVLPPDVRVLSVEDVDAAFHARHHARSKTYRYAMATGPLVLPFERRYCWHIPMALDLEAMTKAAALFEGEHDFAAFQSTGSSVATSRRLVFRSRIGRGVAAVDEIAAIDDEVNAPRTPWGSLIDPDRATTRLFYEVAATGFLRHMVRAMVGTLAEIGMGRRPIDAVSEALRSKNRMHAGATAPARGLCLVRVEYGPDAP